MPACEDTRPSRPNRKVARINGVAIIIYTSEKAVAFQGKDIDVGEIKEDIDQELLRNDPGRKSEKKKGPRNINHLRGNRSFHHRFYNQNTENCRPA